MSISRLIVYSTGCLVKKTIVVHLKLILSKSFHFALTKFRHMQYTLNH